MILLREQNRQKADKKGEYNMQDYMNVKGRIFDIQRYSIHDGQGIRTIIFLKGCALRCKWCCNPESQSFEIETMTINGKAKVMGKDVTVAEVMDTVKRDLPYYRRSGGGITLSGGECLLQPEFSVGLLERPKILVLRQPLKVWHLPNMKPLKNSYHILIPI